MKKHTIGVFAAREDAEKAINQIHNDLGIANEEISYVYKNTDNEVKEVDTGDISSNTPKEGAEKGARTGAWLGAIAGVAVAAGVLPGLGGILVAGPLLTSLGISGLVGSAAAGAITGAAAGGLIGALSNLGVGQEKAKRYQDRVMAGDILLTVHTDNDKDVESVMQKCGATEVETYTVQI
jgi:hypothetical protein